MLHKITYIDDLRLLFDGFSNKTQRGRDADAYYRRNHEIDTAIGHSLGASVSLALEKQYKKGTNPYGVVQSKSFGAPVLSGSLGSRFGGFCKLVVQNSVSDLGVARGLATGAFLDSVTYWVF